MYVAVALISATVAFSATAAPVKAAFNPLKATCTAAGLFSGWAGKACSLATHGGRLISAGKKLLGGDPLGAGKALLGGGSKAGVATTALALGALGAWAVGGAGFVLHATSTVIGHTTEPQLTSTWFSATYWRVAGIAAVLTLPFLFAAAIQALVQSDITLLIRAAFGYLPVSLLAVAIAAPITMLLLSASDQLAAIVSSAAGHQTVHFLRFEGAIVGAVAAGISPFVVFFLALLTVGAALVLWIELLMRAAAVYVIVLLLPLVFAAFVWPARRVWVVRTVEVLLALIFSKFVIVAVLALGGAALSQGAAHWSFVGAMAGVVLLVLAAFAPWALLRLLPVTEIASAAAGSLRREGHGAMGGAGRADAWANHLGDWANKAAQMKRDAEGGEPGGSGADSAHDGLADGGGGGTSAGTAAANGTASGSAGGGGASADTSGDAGEDGTAVASDSADGVSGSAAGASGSAGEGAGAATAEIGSAAESAGTGATSAAADRTAAGGQPESGATASFDLARALPGLRTDEEGATALGKDDLPPGAITPQGGSGQPHGDGSHLDEPHPTPAPQDPEGGRLKPPEDDR
jgi:hypothetical protein